MTRITMARHLDAPAPAVWAVVADPAVYAEVAPNLASVEVVAGEAEGMVRRCVDTDGNAWLETCRRWEPGRGFAVAVDVETSDFHRRLFSRFEGEWWVSPRGDGADVEVAFDFDTRYGPLGWLVGRYLRSRAPGIVEAIFDGWEAELEARREGADESPRPDRVPAGG